LGLFSFFEREKSDYQFEVSSPKNWTSKKREKGGRRFLLTEKKKNREHFPGNRQARSGGNNQWDYIVPGKAHLNNSGYGGGGQNRRHAG